MRLRENTEGKKMTSIEINGTGNVVMNNEGYVNSITMAEAKSICYNVGMGCFSKITIGRTEGLTITPVSDAYVNISLNCVIVGYNKKVKINAIRIEENELRVGDLQIKIRG